MKYRLTCIVFLLLAFTLIIVGCQKSEREQKVEVKQWSVQQQNLVDQLNRSAQYVFEYVKEDKPEQARTELNALEELMLRMNFDQITHVEGVEALSQAIVEGKKNLAAVQYDRNQSLYTAIQIRLAVDALKKNGKAMWQQYDKVIAGDVRQLRAAIDGNDRDAVSVAFERTKSHIALIKPALLIRKTPSQVEAVDSLLVAMQERISHETLAPFRALVEHYATLMNELFQDDAEDTFVTIEDVKQRPILWSTIIGSLIVSVLAYVGWRKYRYEKDHYVVVNPKDPDVGE